MNANTIDLFIKQEELKYSYEVVLEDLCQCGLFRGIYDAKNGSDLFMDGIATVMEAIAEKADRPWFTDDFITNRIKSKEKALNNNKK